MKDLDFDELDKAVSSLMTSVPKDEPPKEDEVKTVTLPASPENEGLPSSAPTDTLNTSAPTPQAPAMASLDTPRSASLATRRGGRFMDMVHPSADMKKTEQPTKPVSRQGTTLSPVSSTPEALPDPTPPTASSTVPEVAAPSAPIEASTPHQPPVKSDWPDPLEVANFKGETKESPQKEEQRNEPEPEVKTETVMSTDEKKNEPAPLTSPFLPDTKVEKRPLGGSAASSDTPPALPIQGVGKENLTVDDPNVQLPASPLETEPPLPEELQGDLVAIESGSGTPKESSEPATPPSVAEEKPAPVSPKEPEESVKSKENPLHSGPVSIPQQYKEEPSTGDKESGAIYDTDTYHQPLAHPAKKKSGWLWVVWIVLILVLGASAGVALYFLGVL